MSRALMRAAFVIVAAAAAAAGNGLPLDKVRAIEQLISVEMSRQGIPGMSIAVGRGEGVIWSNGYGLADLENFVPAKANTRYRTASIAKAMTAVAALQMREAGKLELDAPVQKYVPEFPTKEWPITLRQLLGHLGGIRHYRGDFDNTKHYPGITESLKVFEDDPLVAEPGTRYNYSTYGFVLVGAAVEHAAGMPFTGYLAANVFAPAGMASTRTDDVYAIIPNRSRGYYRTRDGRVVNCMLHDTSVKVPGGGLVSTAEDLVRFALAVGAGKLLKPSAVEEMWTSQTLRDGNPTGYGMGWGVGVFEGRKSVGHGGGQAGVTTYLRYLPEEKLALAMMFNLEGVRYRELLDSITKLLLE